MAVKRRKGKPMPPAISGEVTGSSLVGAYWIARLRKLSDRQELALGIAAVVGFFVFVFSNTNGDISLRGDDVLFMAHGYPFRWDYFAAVAGRAYLTPFYSLVYDICGQSSHLTHLFWFALFAASAVLLFLVLRRFTGVCAAALAAMFYVGYAGKWEIITWISAGAYILISAVLFLAIWIATREHVPLWKRAVAITVLLWAGTLLCEVLIVLAPLYPLLEWTQRKLRRLPIRWGELAFTLLPSAMFAAHVSIIASHTPPGQQAIWFRGEQSHSLGPLFDAAWKMLLSGVSQGFGAQHWTFVSTEVTRFWKLIPVAAWGWAGLVLAAVALLVLWGQRKRSEDHHVALWLLGATSAYLAVISPVLGFTTNQGTVPSRLLTLSGIGLATLVGVVAAAALRLRPWLALPVLAILGYFTFLEGSVMHNLLYQQQTSWAVDQKLRSQFLASGIRPQPGDGIFVSLPFDNRWGTLWSQGGPQAFQQNAGVLVVHDFGMMNGSYPMPIEQRLYYWGWIRGPRERRVPVPLPAKHPFCFWADEQYRLTPAKCAGPVAQLGDYLTRTGAGSLYEE